MCPKKKKCEKVCVTKKLAYISTMNNEQNPKMMTIQQANTTAKGLVAHIANAKTRRELEIPTFVVLSRGWSVEAAKIAIEFMLESPKFNK